jgi:predicted nucleic acid-binding protein
MTFADAVAGDALFLDANTLVYDFGAHPVFGSPCKALLKRIASGDLTGFISASVLNDVAHRLMTLEAVKRSAGLTPE